MTEAMQRVIVLANRAPLKHEWVDGEVSVTRSASGLVTALEPLLETYQGTWVAHAAGSVDRQMADGHVGIEALPANHSYRMRYVSLPEDQYRGYYFGFANEGLWPLCHTARVTPVFRRRDYEMYRAANTRFAAAVADEAGGGAPLVLVQDYHFALAPKMVRQHLPEASIVAFWHIPWPRLRTFYNCPWAAELLEGLLGSDIVGFQTDDDCRNFLGAVEALLPATVDPFESSVRYQGRVTSVRAYPVGVDCAHDAVRLAPPTASARASVLRDLELPPDVRLGVGVDRMDYTKGINEKFLAIEQLLEAHPELVGRFVFAQIAEPSRDCLTAYRDARQQVIGTRDRINARFASGGVEPLRLLEQHHEPADVYRYYRAADFCYVNSLQDGMNLVAKEFVSAREDERGVLVLSEFAGAARQLRSALLVNPLRIAQSAAALWQALSMPVIEQAKRLQVMRDNVRSFDATWWARQMVEDAAQHHPHLAHAQLHQQWSPAVA